MERNYERRVLELFLHNSKLKFNEIEKKLNERSNKVSYYLTNLVKKNVLEKNGDYYFLSEFSETLIPYLSDKKGMLPVILIYLGDEKGNKCFLYNRTKRPFKNKLSLPGGRIFLGESIEEGSKRIMREKFGIEIEFKKVNSVSIEHVKKNEKIIHSFVLFFVFGKAKNKLDLISLKGNKSKIIESDYNLIKNSLGKKLDVGFLESRIDN